MKKSVFMKFSILLTLVSLVAGCAGLSETSPSGFLQNYSEMSKGTYFVQEHASPTANFSKYDSVKIAPVNFDYLTDKTVCSADDLEDLGHAFRKDLEEQLTAQGFKITAVPTEKTLVLSIAITNVELPARVFNAAKSLAPFPFSMIPTDTDGTTAFEGKITDGPSGKVLAQFAEQASGAGDSHDVKAMIVGGYAKFMNAETVFKRWAEKIAEMLSNLKELSQESKTGK
ncbi:MAG TPA: DUF3313 family protein [Candidatus Omnitrophota bacterium]|mgnify:CR=1 FL=1|nr:DUF3313 family protein [Candidatus Omnitrophota bacterium]